MKTVRQISVKMILFCLLMMPAVLLAVTGNSSTAGTYPKWMSFNKISDNEYSTTDILSAVGLQDMLESGELKTVSKIKTRFGNTIRMKQFYQGIPILGASVVIRTTTENQPRSIYTTLALWTHKASLSEGITSEEARSIAVKQVKPAGLRGSIEVRRIVFPFKDAPLLCWQVLIPASDPLDDWEIIVSASDGSILMIEDQLRFINGNGRVFDPDPITATEDTTLNDDHDSADAIPNEAYSEIELNDISRDDEDLYILAGSHVDTEPTEDRARLEEAEFMFDREDDRFEEVMAYFHIERQARYLISLGFNDLPPDPQLVNVNGIDEDFSFYSPQTEIITTGSGGVDDAEDADVLLHEYGHALIQKIIADWRGGDSELLSEGLCDYFAGDWSLQTAPDFQADLLFDWDGHNEFWEGRVLNSDYHYPEVSELEPHEAGQLWSSLLTEIRLESGNRDTWNTVIIDHLYSLGDSATVPIAAEALLESDQQLVDGQLRQLIVNACESREIFTSGQYSPQITHLPLRDTEDVNSSFRVTTNIQSDHLLDEDGLLLIYRFNDDDPDSITLESSDNEDQYQAFIPAPRREVDVFYYLSASDTSGVFNTFPAEAPLEWLTFHVGPDRISPVILEVDSLPNSPFPDAEMAIGARVTDNIGVAEVSIVWYWGWLEPGGIITLERSQVDTNLFTGRLHWSVDEQNFIRYMVTAVDVSDSGNTVSGRLNTFEITSNVMVDDFERQNRRWNWDGWLRTDQAHVNGTWSLHDRPENDEQNQPRDAVAEIDEDWNLAIFDRARLRFWEKHEFDSRAGERCVLEIREIDSDRWREVIRFTGSQDAWQIRAIELPEYCMGRAEPVRVRFRTRTPRNAENRDGMRIDDLQLLTGNLVDVDSRLSGNDKLPVSLELSAPFPNPTNSKLSFHYQLPDHGKVKLTDIYGRIVLKQRLSKGVGVSGINMNAYPTGLYILTLASAGKYLNRKVILLK